MGTSWGGVRAALRGGWRRRRRGRRRDLFRGGSRRRGGAGRLRRSLGLVAALLVLGPALPVACLRVVDPPSSAVMLAHELRAWRAGEQGVAHHFVPLEAISPHLAVAVLAAEDQRFPEHAGIDLRAVRRAVEERIAGARLRGASTLSQQVAKNLFLWSGRSWLRKGLEAGLALWIDALWPKRRILEVYLNIAQMGPRTYGAEAASRRFFGRPARALSPEQAALLAAVLPNPRVLRADAPSPYVRERAATIAAQARQLGGPAFLRRLDVHPGG